MSSHSSDRVIKDDYRRITLIVSDIGKSGHSRMHESRISDNGYSLSFAFFAKCLVKSMNRTDGSTHTSVISIALSGATAPSV